MAIVTNFPILPLDIPDPDVIRIGDTYYMVTTTMHFNPGAEILRSYDLVHWEHASFVYNRMDEIPDSAQKLEGAETIYGNGMWAASLRYHKGKFYVLFVANDTHRTYLFISSHVDGPWEYRHVEGFYHDPSLLFDDDGRIYVASGNTEIRLTQLKSDLSGPEPEGINRLIVRDNAAKVRLGYEGSHIYKINGRYYLFLIHWPIEEEGRRTEACFVTDSLDSEFIGKDIFDDDMGFDNSGVAQGGIVDDPAGNWYAVLFQDRGALGRMPVLIPVEFDEENFPVFGINGKVPDSFTTLDNRPDYIYHPLIHDDDFNWASDHNGAWILNSQWEWNHLPVPQAWTIEQSPDTALTKLALISEKLSNNVIYARNTLTTRTVYPYCIAEVTVDGRDLRDGDHAGMVAMLSCYGTIELARRNTKLLVVMTAREAVDHSLEGVDVDYGYAPVIAERDLPTDATDVRLKIIFDSRDGRDMSRYWYLNPQSQEWICLGEHELFWKLDQFTGCRIGLFLYSTQIIGATARFSNFTFNTNLQ